MPTDQLPASARSSTSAASASRCASRNGPSVGRADLLLALDQHLHVARQRALGAQPRPHGRDVRDRARLVVGGAAAEQPAVALARLERVARPPVDVARAAARRGARRAAPSARRRPRRSTRRRRTGDRRRRRAAARRAARTRASAPATASAHGSHVVRVLGIGADARDAHERLELARAASRSSSTAVSTPAGIWTSVMGAHHPWLSGLFGAVGSVSSARAPLAALLLVPARRLRAAHVAGTEPFTIMLSSASPSRSANTMWPSTATQMPSANQSCTNVAPVRQSRGNGSNHCMIDPVAEHHDARRRR